VHFEDMGEYKDDEPYISACVEDGGCGHDRIVTVASTDGEVSCTGQGIAEKDRERDEDCAVDTDEGNGTED